MAGSNDQAYDDAYNRGFQSGFNATYHPKAGGTGQLLGKGAGQSGDYALIEESGGEAVTFDSLEKYDVKAGGGVLTEPIEEGSFTTYNKIADPVEVGVTLLSQASFDEQAAILEKLKAYARDPVKLILVTPEAAYDSLTLESYSYSRTREAGATLLAVDLTLKEVREVETNVTTEATAPPISQDNAKNPGSTTKKSTGKAGTKEVKEPEKNRSALRKTTGREL